MTKTLTEQQIIKIIENGTLKAAKVCEKKFYGKPKSLTEQWREGTLPAGCYYVLSTEDDTPVACDIDVVCDFMIRDVVAPVPSYDEYQRLVSNSDELEKKLAIATKSFHEIMYGVGTGKYDDYAVVCCCDDALIEMKGVK